MTEKEGDAGSARARERIGTWLEGKWRIDGLLGAGGMATVYAATHRNQNRVAIKILHPELAARLDLSDRFAREGYVANTVGHPGVVKVLDDGVTPDGAPFLVMELLEGENLEARGRRRNAVMSASETLAVAEQLLDVAAAAHRAGIVHRDIKPDNLFLTTEGRLKVLDFGIARLTEASHDGSHGTQAGSLLGTPPFMAPEQARGRWNEVDERTDIWGIGATLFKLVSGWLVHNAENPTELLVIAATEHAVPLRQRAPDAPDALAAIIDRALLYDKAARWQSADEMLSAVRDAIAGHSVDSIPRMPAPSLSAIAQMETIKIDAPVPGSLHTTARPLTHTTPDAGRSRWARFAIGLGATGALAVAIALTLGPSYDERPASAPVRSGSAETERVGVESERPESAPTARAADRPLTPAPSAAAFDAGTPPRASAERAPDRKPARRAGPVPRRETDDDLYDRRR